MPVSDTIVSLVVNCLTAQRPTLTTSLQQKKGMHSAALLPEQPPASQFLENLLHYNFVGEAQQLHIKYLPGKLD